MVRSPVIRAAAERRGIRTDDVTFTSYDFQTNQVTLRHSESRLVHVGGFGELHRLITTGEDVFVLDEDDRPEPCPTCGKR